MRVAILAGGMGTRLQEETGTRPKPMVEIGGQPILWHIMQQYAHQGFSDFCVALGYMGEFIKRYFVDACQLSGRLSVDFSTGRIDREGEQRIAWRVNLIDTGADTMTGGRIARLRPWLGQETFMVTYGDGVSDVDLHRLLGFHRRQGKLATITAVRPPARFGGLTLDGPAVTEFAEKPQSSEGWINGGFMVLEPGVFDYLDGDGAVLERDGLERLAADGQLAAYRHEGFWQCMDTLRDKNYLNRLWDEGDAPWRPAVPAVAARIGAQQDSQSKAA